MRENLEFCPLALVESRSERSSPMTNARLGLVRPMSQVTKVALVAAAGLMFQGCGPDMGPPPDQTAKNNPAVPEKEPKVKAPGGGGLLKVKSIKDRS
jgi:hypothetical protein